jgi:signal peptidase I
MKNWLRENRSFLVFMFILFAARSSFADHYVVPSGSMEGTLFPGDRVVVDKHAYGLRIPFTLVKVLPGEAPARGDVIVFDEPASGTRLIKRIVATGGDSLEVRNGHVFINGKPGDAKAVLNLQMGGGPDVGPVRVPDGQVFAMGDFRGNSRDSRYFGFVPVDRIYAKASRVYYRTGEGFIWKQL